jgi:hypothetical protein
MKSTQTLKFIRLNACMIVVVALSASAFASCGDSLSAMAALAATARSPQAMQQTSAATRSSEAKGSIVGLWHIQFMVGDQTIQEAFQLWNAGGTEVHNPNVDPRTGNVCLGVWRHAQHGTYKLAHRVWQYDANGTFMGTIHLSETLTLGDDSKTHSGTFTLDFFDPAGNFQFEVPGNVIAERILVD